MDWFKRKDKQYFSYDHDIHSHILPGLDDGVKRVEDSVVIVKKMLELGVKQFSFTPHISFPSPDSCSAGSEAHCCTGRFPRR